MITLKDDLLTYQKCSNLVYAVIVQAAEQYFEFSRAVMRGGSRYGQSVETMEKYVQQERDFFLNKTGYYKFYREFLEISPNSDLASGEKILAQLDAMIADEENYPADRIHLAS